MTVIVCLDDHNGMMFNHRRQSRDSKVKEAVQKICAGHALWMNEYTARLYADLDGVDVQISPDFLQQAREQDYCFVESDPLQPVSDRITGLILFRWNRHYPSDMWFDLKLQYWNAVSEEDFAGSSHERITKLVYIRRENRM